MRAVLGLCLPLLLVACGGGLLPTATPFPTPTTPLNASRQPVLTLAVPMTEGAPANPTPASASLSLSDLVSAPEHAPEIVGGLVSAVDRDRYVRYVAALRARDAAAANWLVSTGLLLKDAKIDPQEMQLVHVILNRKDDPLWYLAHARTQEGLTDQDIDYLESSDAKPSDSWFLDDDIRGLEGYNLLSRDGQRGLQRLFEQAHQDIELREGLAIINAMGLPDSRAFKYPVPLYNVQLYVLSRLLEQGLPLGYERAAVAAACTYGSLATLCDEEARGQVLDYAGERVRFLIDTDVVLAAAGARWRSTDYTLEALMLLFWGGQATALPQPGQPLAAAPDLVTASATHPLSKNDLTSLLVDLAKLRQVQEEMMRTVVEHADQAAAAADLIERWWSEHWRDQTDEGGPDFNRQWARYRDGLGFAGGADAGYVLQGLAASVNLPMPWVQLWYAEKGQLHTVPSGLRLDAATGMLRLSGSAWQNLASLPPETKASLVGWRVPWDNWHLREGVRSCETLPLPLSVWQMGIPSGYLLRQGVLVEADALAALGLNPTPTAESKGG